MNSATVSAADGATTGLPEGRGPSAPWRVLRAAPWPVAVGLGSLAVSLGALATGWSLAHSPLHAETSVWKDPEILGGWLLLECAGWLGLSAVAWLDVLARCRDYRRFRAAFGRRGFAPRLARAGMASRCQRDAVTLACRHAGHGDAARTYYRAQGYRWWHLLPDLMVDNPLAFFRPEALRRAFLPGKAGRDAR
ncbi:MAG: hypothetical protein AB7D57_14725 [Desulfovibrionaceae bacterium]